MGKNLYAAVTPDEFEHILAVEETMPALARCWGTSLSAVKSAICKKKSGKNNGVRFIRIALEEHNGEEGAAA